MSKECEFVKECGTFFVLSINQEFPAGRPFGAIMEIDDKIYISTADTKEVYRQLKENGNMQILALKPGTRNWLRITGRAMECDSKELKQKMLVECPVLLKHYASAESPHYNIFEISVINSEWG